MSAPYTPSYPRQRRSVWAQAFDVICLWVIFGSIFAAALGGAAMMPSVIP